MIQDISRIVAVLKHRQGSSGIFGAEKHRFRLRPHSAEEIARLEFRLGVRLPDSYRHFLIEAGSGAGPYYGIYSADELLENFVRIQAYLEDEQPRPSPAKDFVFSRNDAAKAELRLREKASKPWLSAPWPTDGCVPICFQGCTYWTALITAGECVGTVWDVGCNQGTDGEWLPARPPLALLDRKRRLPEIACPPSFLEWYEAWVSQVEADCPTATTDSSH